MAKTYIENIKHTAVRNKIFSLIDIEKQQPIFEVIKLSSGDYLPTTAMINGDYPVYGGGGQTNKNHNQFNVIKRTFGIGRVGARCGCVFEILPNSWVTDNALFAIDISPDYDINFLIEYLNFRNINQFANTSAQPVISLKRMSNITIPIVDLDSQKEIVEILENFENCDFNIKNDRYGINSIITLTDVNESLSFELLQQLQLVKNLRQQLLQDAVQGKLVEQNTNDEPASDLLQKIKAEKERLIKDKKLKKDKDLPQIKQEEIPFDIPQSWIWCRFREIGQITGGGTPSMGVTEYWDGHIPWISPKDMKLSIVSDSEMRITNKAIKESTTNLIPVGSLLIVGRSGILKRKLPIAINSVECTVNQDMKVLIPYITEMNRYLQFMLRGIETIILDDYVKFGMTVHSLKYDEFANMLIPLPPINEQYVIVQKLDQLMQNCDALETSIKQSQLQNEQLLQQILREALTKDVELEAAI